MSPLRKSLIALGAAALLLLLALGPGDVVNRRRAAAAHAEGVAVAASATGENLGPWIYAFDALQLAVTLRPDDETYQNDFRAAQETWLKQLDAKAAGRPPVEILRLFDSITQELWLNQSGHPGPAPTWQDRAPELTTTLTRYLSDPFAQGLRDFALGNLALVRRDALDKIEQAEMAIAQGKFAEADDLIREVESLAEFGEGLAEGAAALREMETTARLTRVQAALDRGDIGQARAELDAFALGPASTELQAAARFRLAIDEFKTLLKDAAGSAAAGYMDHARALLANAEQSADHLLQLQDFALATPELTPAERADLLAKAIDHARAAINGAQTPR